MAARRYARDNKGRFAPAGQGATARGGRLRTAAGNKRATETKQIKSGNSSGKIAKPKKTKTNNSTATASTSKATTTKIAANNAARVGVKSFKRSGKSQRVSGQSTTGTISKSKDTRNQKNRKEAFKRKVNRASDNLRGAGKTYNTYAKAHKFGNAPGQGAQIERSYKQALKREATAKKALAVYQGTARPTTNDARVYGRPYGMNRPAVSRTSKGYKPASTRLPKPSKATQRQGRAMANRVRGSQENKRHYTGQNRAATRAVSSRALKFYKNPASYLKSAKNKRNQPLREGRGFKLPRSLRP